MVYCTNAQAHPLPRCFLHKIYFCHERETDRERERDRERDRERETDRERERERVMWHWWKTAHVTGVEKWEQKTQRTTRTFKQCSEMRLLEAKWSMRAGNSMENCQTEMIRKVHHSQWGPKIGMIWILWCCLAENQMRDHLVEMSTHLKWVM